MIWVPPLPFPWSVFLFPVCIARQHPLAWAGVGGSKSYDSTETLVLYTVHNTHFTTEAMKYNIPAPPIAASLILTGKLMIYRENPAKYPSFGKKSAKVNHCLYSSTEQLQMAL